MQRQQFTKPVVVRGELTTSLDRLSFDASQDEDWFQKLLFRCPSLLPVEEIEPGFGRLIPVAREISTDRGPMDLLYIDVHGHLIIVETKLYRNPEGRRTVVGQILDYAANLATWSYADLAAAVRLATKTNTADPLAALARNAKDPDFDESRFIEAITLNLQRGRFLLLVVGDGIHEGVADMEKFLQREPQLSFRFAAIELALFKLGEREGDILVQPRVIAMTNEITRFVVEVRSPIQPSDIVVRLPDQQIGSSVGNPSFVRGSLTEEEFFSKLKANNAEAAQLAAALIAESSGHSLRVVWMKNGPILKFFTEIGGKQDDFNFGQLTPDGKLAYTVWLSMKCNRLDLPQEIWKPYYDSLLQLMPNCRIIEGHERGIDAENWAIGNSKGEDPDATPLLRKRDVWLKAIDDVIARIQKAAVGKD